MNKLAEDLKLPEEIAGLNVKETKFVISLLCHGSIPKAGQEAGINRNTAYKWANSEKINVTLDRLRKALAMQSLNRNKLFMNTAVDKVFEIMNDEKSSKNTQLNAAKILIEIADRSIEKTDIIERLNDLERLEEKDEEVW